MYLLDNSFDKYVFIINKLVNIENSFFVKNIVDLQFRN